MIMSKYQMYKEYCLLNGLVPCRYESIKQFATDYPNFCSYSKWGTYDKSTWLFCSKR